MKGFKQIFALIFTIATVVFGVLIMIDEKDVFESIKLVKDADEMNRGIGIIAIILLVVNVLLIALPLLTSVLVLTGNFDPFKAIVDTALVILLKFVLTIFAFMLLMIVWKAPADVWKAYFFDKDSLAIIPLVVFLAAFILLIVAKASNFEGTLIRAVLATVGAGLAVFGLVFYFILGNGTGFLGGSMGKNPDALTIFGIVLGLAIFGGLVAYSYLPQTRDFKKAE